MTTRNPLDPAQGPTRPTVNKSLHKALRLLNCFTEAHCDWSVSDLSRHLKMSKSSVSTMLKTFAAAGLVQQSPTTQRYQLGLRCLELGYLASSRLVLRDYAYPHLEALLGETNHIVYMAILHQGEILYIEALYPPRRKTNYSSQGRRMPLYCTGIGKAALAFMPTEYIERYLQATTLHGYTATTITSPDTLRHELASIRTRGYATDRQEREEGIQCVAAPIKGAHGQLIASISVSGAASEITEASFAELAQKVLQSARDISHKLTLAGYQPQGQG